MDETSQFLNNEEQKEDYAEMIGTLLAVEKEEI